MPFDQLSLSDLKLGLADLLDRHGAELDATRAGALFGPSLRERHKAIQAIPEALIGGTPLADQLRRGDVTHDGFGGAVYFLVEAYLRAPSTAPALLEALTTVRLAFVPELAALQASYPDEAAAAHDHRKHLKKHLGVLRSVPLAEGLTLADWVTSFLDAGDALGALLRARGDLTPASRKSAATERSATVGLLNQFRAGLACEFPPGSKKLAAFDRALFGYFDTLEAHRAAGATTPVRAPDPSPPAPENPTP